MKLAVLTATTDPARAATCLRSWNLPESVELIVVVQTQTEEIRTEGIVATWLKSHEYLGSVPAFRLAVDYALEKTDAEILACLHDDVEILQADWVERVIRHFETTPACGLAGFGGAIGVGADDIYRTPYNPMQLARIGFRSNLIDAEVHGLRSLLAEPVACLDGFSQIGRREFFKGTHRTFEAGIDQERPWSYLEDHGMIHHFYDSALGLLAARYGWETWYLPIRCRHYGGQTAVADRGYQAWAAQQIPEGDHGFWIQSHKVGYELFNDVLPLRV